ncbi:sulfite exporter TauE/SafE family protein [Tranquillimonas alkanivorans]|uniref:Probable membrane transporter protein n=1 Tax=Tranquillimonas alkanivorans TaxID=441119 RepID=A0A1I5RHL3_9RHOB|nr:sulfite exporter TauE/SafE family protein [Tranquillimonas alkanivorans]SFP57817.1 hypothetical protein SAMN04488047_108172 [Tranquillimonas alkanivorans]
MIWAFLALALGGVLKGATGAGAPIIAVPVMAILFDVPFAIAIFSVPNLVSNLWQGWHYRSHQLDRRFTVTFALAGALGAGIGTFMLANLPQEALLILVALSVFAYIAFRLARPDWVLPFAVARRIALPVGTLAGVMQGAAGVSAPVSITFLNALRTERSAFVATISVFFAAMAVVQIPLLGHYGFLTWERLAWSCAALVPLLAAMPVGAFLARRISKQVFDRLILGLLALVALRLLIDAFS